LAVLKDQTRQGMEILECVKKKKKKQYQQQLEHLIAQIYSTDVAHDFCNKIGLLQAAFIDDMALWIIYYLMNITDVE
jgi:hypothetical protein